MILKVKQIYDWRELDKFAIDSHINFPIDHLPDEPRIQLYKSGDEAKVGIRIQDINIIESDVPLLIIISTDKTWDKCRGGYK